MSIMEDSENISRRFKKKYTSLQKQLVDLEQAIDVASIEFKEAAGQGDHSENAAFDEAKKRITELSTQKAYILYSIESINRNTSDKIYNPKAEIDLYSTFKLKMLSTGDISTWKVFPGSVSDVECGILSEECLVFKVLKGKRVGDVIDVTNLSNSSIVKFEILEVY